MERELDERRPRQFCFSQSLIFKMGLFGFLALGFVASRILMPTANESRLARELTSPPPGLVHFHFGFRYAMADGLWVRALQDFDFCEQELAEHLCRGRGWLFQILDLVTSLDPHFQMAYSAGGTALTILVSDYEGASRLFDKGVAEFPHDWVLLYKAAYHALQEEKNPEKAAELMERAARNGAPDWVFILAGRLHTDAGRRELAERVLAEMKAMNLDEHLLERLRQKIEEGPSKSSR